ncbi:hypothetical protein JCM1393_08340 [Clostridium carnis]
MIGLKKGVIYFLATMGGIFIASNLLSNFISFTLNDSIFMIAILVLIGGIFSTINESDGYLAVNYVGNNKQSINEGKLEKIFAHDLKVNFDIALAPIACIISSIVTLVLAMGI